MENSTSPLISVVVVIVSDTTGAYRDASFLKECLEALAHQVDAPSFEVIVPYKPPVVGLDELERQYPQVNFIPVERLKTFVGAGSREHHDELRACGLAAARGEIIALLEDHALPDPNWCAQIAQAHREQFAAYAGVGGAIENGIDRPLNWAVYFCDFGKYENPVMEGESVIASDANVSYKRAALETIKPVWQDIFHETAVNWALTSRGDKLALSPRIVVYQNRRQLTLGNALQERFIWGRSYAATRSELAGGGKRLTFAALSPVLPAILIARMASNAFKKGRHVDAFVRALPLLVLLTVSWSCGEFVGYITARASSKDAPATDSINPAQNPAGS